jgi:hypothetical protein
MKPRVTHRRALEDPELLGAAPLARMALSLACCYGGATSTRRTKNLHTIHGSLYPALAAG